MSESILTKGWPAPKGNCDMCEKRPATHWFGDTSVALCNAKECQRENQNNWDRMIAEDDGAQT